MSTEASSTTATTTATERSAQETIKAFMSALERLDLDAALALAADDIRWVNVPIPTGSNKRQFEQALRAMFGNLTHFAVEYRDIHERGDGVVYTDRIDIAEGGGVSMKLPVKGEFRVRDGLVTEWVDRFSWPKLIGDIVKSLPAIIAFRFRR